MHEGHRQGSIPAILIKQPKVDLDAIAFYVSGNYVDVTYTNCYTRPTNIRFVLLLDGIIQKRVIIPYNNIFELAQQKSS